MEALLNGPVRLLLKDCKTEVVEYLVPFGNFGGQFCLVNDLF